jgi:hypothetical protein
MVRMSVPVGDDALLYSTPAHVVPSENFGAIRRELSPLRWLAWQSEHGIVFPDHAPPWK